MKKSRVLAAVFIVSLFGLPALPRQVFAAPKIGSTCKKISTFQQSASVLLVCDVVKKKKVWRKATSIEKTLYLQEKNRLDRAAAQKIIDETAAALAEKLAAEKLAAEKLAAEKAAADKLAADKLAADKLAADKLAADKLAADKLAADKLAAEKAAADAAAKAAADAAAKAAADAAAETPNLLVGSLYSGIDADSPEWRWIAVRVTNSASTKIYSHGSFNILMGDAGGGIVDSNFEGNFPLIGPKQTVWYVTTQFKGTPASQVVFQKQYSTRPSPLSVSEFPTVSNPRLIPSPYLSTRKSVIVTVKNNSSQVLSKSSSADAVLLDASGTPLYAASGFFDKAILPGGSADIIIGDDFTYNGTFASIEVTVSPLL